MSAGALKDAADSALAQVRALDALLDDADHRFTRILQAIETLAAQAADNGARLETSFQGLLQAAKSETADLSARGEEAQHALDEARTTMASSFAEAEGELRRSDQATGELQAAVEAATNDARARLSEAEKAVQELAAEAQDFQQQLEHEVHDTQALIDEERQQLEPLAQSISSRAQELKQLIEAECLGPVTHTDEDVMHKLQERREAVQTSFAGAATHAVEVATFSGDTRAEALLKALNDLEHAAKGVHSAVAELQKHQEDARQQAVAAADAFKQAAEETVAALDGASSHVDQLVDLFIDAGLAAL